MRNIFIKKLITRARKNKKVFLLTGDLGYNCFENFKKEFPNRFINVGVAENNMMGIGTGLALSGKEVYIYSIIPFLIYKTFEHIRNYIAAENLNIKLIGAGGSYSYGNLGISHNPIEDIAIMKTLPNIKIFNPGTKIEAEQSIDLMFKEKGSFYIRLGKVPNTEIHSNKNKIKIGEGIKIGKNSKITIITSGNIIENVISVKKNLEKKGYQLNLISYPSVHPINKNYVLKNININSKIIFIEENIQIGSLKNTIMNILNELYNKKINTASIMINNQKNKKNGNQEYLRKLNNLSVKKMEIEILKILKVLK